MSRTQLQMDSVQTIMNVEHCMHCYNNTYKYNNHCIMCILGTDVLLHLHHSIFFLSMPASICFVFSSFLYENHFVYIVFCYKFKNSLHTSEITLDFFIVFFMLKDTIYLCLKSNVSQQTDFITKIQKKDYSDLKSLPQEMQVNWKIHIRIELNWWKSNFSVSFSRLLSFYRLNQLWPW